MSSNYDITFRQAREAMNHLGDPHWCPPGGTSNHRWHEISDASAAALHEELDRRVAADKRMWIKTYGEGKYRTTYIGWRDDPNGGYYVSTGVEHQHYLAEDQLRSFGYLVYTREAAGDGPIERREGEIGHRYFEPPYTHDAVLRVDHLMSWANAHRRILGLDNHDTAAPPAPRPDGTMTRAQVEQTYEIALPEDLGDGPFTIFNDVDNGVTDEPCTVAVTADTAFCVTCEAHGHLDGYTSDRHGVQDWHRSL